MKHSIFTLLILGVLTSCTTPKKKKDIAINTPERSYRIEKIVDNLDNPWGMTWLPDGSMLITEKSGTLIHFKNGIKTEIENVPEVYNRGQGGLLDIATNPDFENNGWIYFTYASTEGEGEGGHTKLSRAKLEKETHSQISKIFTKQHLILQRDSTLAPELLLKMAMFTFLLGNVVQEMLTHKT